MRRSERSAARLNSNAALVPRYESVGAWRGFAIDEFARVSALALVEKGTVQSSNARAGK